MQSQSRFRVWDWVIAFAAALGMRPHIAVG